MIHNPEKHRAVQCSNTGILKDDIEHFVLMKLSELETQKVNLKDDIYSMEQELSKYAFDENTFRKMFQTARMMFQEGKLTTNKALIDRYVDKIIIYKSYIEIYFNMGGTSTFPTNDIVHSADNERRSFRKRRILLLYLHYKSCCQFHTPERT